MPVLQNAENAIEKVFSEISEKIEEFDGDALSAARQALSAAKEAEQGVIAASVSYRNQLVALADQYGPQIAEIGESLLSEVKSLLSGG